MIKLSHPTNCPYCMTGYALPNKEAPLNPRCPAYKCNSCSVYLTEWELENLSQNNSDEFSKEPQDPEVLDLLKGGKWSWGKLPFLGFPTKGPGLSLSSGHHRILVGCLGEKNSWKAVWSWGGVNLQVSKESSSALNALTFLGAQIQNLFDDFPWEAIPKED